MKLSGTVLNCSFEERELVGKDGLKKSHKIGRVLLLAEDDGAKSAVSVRLFDSADYSDPTKLPAVGAKWTTPRVKRYECFDGQIAEVMV